MIIIIIFIYYNAELQHLLCFKLDHSCRINKREKGRAIDKYNVTNSNDDE